MSRPAPTAGGVHPAQTSSGASVVLLTTGTRHAAGIVRALADEGLRPDAILFERPKGRRALAQVRDAWRRRGATATLRAITRRLAGRIHPSTAPWQSPDFFARWTRRLITVPGLREQEAIAVLEALRPDFLVLGGAPILPEAVLQTARLGTLNAHPGMLPRYRGVDVVAHAVLDGGPIGATVHYVEAGVDTGRVLGRVEVSPDSGESLASLQARVEAAGGTLLARVLARLVRGDEVPAEDQRERFPICRRLPPSKRREAEAMLRRTWRE